MLSIERQTYYFLYLLEKLVSDEKNYLLPVKEYNRVEQDKVLLGYYDDKHIYFIPAVVIGMCDTVLLQNKKQRFDMRGVLERLTLCGMIKAHVSLTGNFYYRPSRRIGNTCRRYITFYRRYI